MDGNLEYTTLPLTRLLAVAVSTERTSTKRGLGVAVLSSSSLIAPMARAHRVAAYAAIFSCIYILVFFSIFPVPFIHSSLSDQILPLVRDALLFFCSLNVLICGRSPGGFLFRLALIHSGV